MKMVTDIQIDLYGEMQYYMASAKQGDKATRYMRVQLMNNGNEFQIPDDVILIANIKKPDGKFCYNECERENNRVMVQLTNQALAAAGTAFCDIEMRSSSGELILSSAAFTLEIEPSMRDESAIESSNEMTFLEKKIQYYIERMIGTEQQVLTTETAVKLAEAARALAENQRVLQENVRIENENARILAERERGQEEQKRQQQEQKRQEDTAKAIESAGDATEEAKKAAGECDDASQRAENALENEEQLKQTLTQAQEIQRKIVQIQSAVETAKRDVENVKKEVDDLFGNGAAGLMTQEEKEKLKNIADRANNYSLPKAGADTLGGVKTGYSANGKNYPVLVDTNGNMYTAVPWTDTKYTHPTSAGNKHIPSGGSSGKILKWSADGTAAWGDDKDTTYGAATQSAAGLQSAADKKKLDGIAEGANKTTVDASLSASSANPVQNKVVKAALDKKVNGENLTFSVDGNNILCVTF